MSRVINFEDFIGWQKTNNSVAPSITPGYEGRRVFLPSGGLTGGVHAWPPTNNKDTKRYFELRFYAYLVQSFAVMGIAAPGNTSLWSTANNDALLWSNGRLEPGNNLCLDGTGPNAGDIFGFAVDTSLRRMWVSRNGVWQYGTVDDTAYGVSITPTTWDFADVQPFVSRYNYGSMDVEGRFRAAVLTYLPAGYSAWDDETIPDATGGVALAGEGLSHFPLVSPSAPALTAGTFGVSSKVFLPKSTYWREEFWGPTENYVDGTVDVLNVPAARLVRLFVRGTGRCVRETWSDPTTGYYKFENLNAAYEYYAVAHDHTRQYNAVVQDMLRFTE
jgi:hypothetical protein